MKIQPNHPIFQSEDYLRDANRFYVIQMNFGSPTLLLHSDGASYVICRGAEWLPTWIWTTDNITQEKPLTPLLYTDYHYASSNTAYKNTGYEETGILINFGCKKEDLS